MVPTSSASFCSRVCSVRRWSQRAWKDVVWLSTDLNEVDSVVSSARVSSASRMRVSRCLPVRDSWSRYRLVM